MNETKRPLPEENILWTWTPAEEERALWGPALPREYLLGKLEVEGDLCRYVLLASYYDGWRTAENQVIPAVVQFLRELTAAKKERDLAVKELDAAKEERDLYEMPMKRILVAATEFDAALNTKDGKKDYLAAGLHAEKLMQVICDEVNALGRTLLGIPEFPAQSQSADGGKEK